MSQQIENRNTYLPTQSSLGNNYENGNHLVSNDSRNFDILNTMGQGSAIPADFNSSASF
jgi:hypothetical protein